MGYGSLPVTSPIVGGTVAGALAANIWVALAIATVLFAVVGLVRLAPKEKF